MAAVTSTIVALGGVGLSVNQAIKAGKEKKAADAAAITAEAAMRAVKEENVMKQVQVPTLGYDLAQQGQAQRDVSAISALQGAGAAGVIGGIGKVAQSGAAADLQLAAQAGQQQYQRDMSVAQAGQGIEGRRAQREFGIESNALAGAQAASAAAQAQQNQAYQGIASGLLGAAGSGQLGLQAMGMEGNYLDNLTSIQQTKQLRAAGQQRYTNTTTKPFSPGRCLSCIAAKFVSILFAKSDTALNDELALLSNILYSLWFILPDLTSLLILYKLSTICVAPPITNSFNVWSLNSSFSLTISILF